MFTPLKQQSLPATEEEVLKFWQDRQVFQQSMDQRKDNEPFVFYEGPPTANGKPGIHHVLSRTYKDVICRYQTMKGRYVLRKAGWDTHGLPVELQVEKALGLQNKQDIEKYGVAAFNEKCKESVWAHEEEWGRVTRRIGYWVDLDHAYVTYSKEYMQSVWWALKQIWDKGLVYQDYKILPYCSRCGTGLSLAEVAQGYKDVTEMSVYIKFKLVHEEGYILAWTTTPWTLPGNVGLAVGKNIPYVKVRQGEDIYYLAEERLKILNGEYEVVEHLTGSDLVGKEYTPLFDFLDLGEKTGKKAYYVLPAEFVTTTDGTGVVHTAVMYGEEDFQLGKQADLPAMHTVNERGEFNELVPPWQGRFVKDAEADIIAYLKEQGSLYKKEQVTHTYPFCWRCNTALLYYARTSWFIRISDELRQRLVELNQEITWVPEHVKNGRFGNWLEGLRDWAISRDRYWGTPLPIWVCDSDHAHKAVVSGVAELRERATAEGQAKLDNPEFDLHKPFIDEIELRCQECDGVMHRVPEVLDVWFDAGSMPFAQWGYPHAGQDTFKNQFPADYISEGIDQTRGWFNTLHIISTLLFDQPAYTSVICLNLVLDEKGQKMSKSKGNIVDPMAVADEVGVDPLRMYFLSVNQPGEYKTFSMKALQDVNRKTVMLWLNVVNFFLTYAELDRWQLGQTGELTLLDRWVMALLAESTAKIDTALAQLDTFTASRTLIDFLDQLSTWYLRRNRKRRDAAFYATLHHVLLETAKLAAPMMPFVAESIYRQLKTDAMPESVHLTDFPVVTETDQALLEQMETLRRYVTLGHAARSEGKLKVRQPLAQAVLVGTKLELTDEMKEILADELNVKQVEVAAEAPTGFLVAEDGGLVIGLDPVLTAELKEEGMLRELVRELQDLRKKSGCKPGELVTFFYATEASELQALLERQLPVLREEVAAQSFEQKAEGQTVTQETTITLDGQTLWVGLLHE